MAVPLPNRKSDIQILYNRKWPYVAFEWAYPAFIHTVSVAIKAKLQ